jgi:gamma-glutamylcyclotransferase (GGCT)/AIG2-like uncharacterized protein YtfP
MSISPKKAIEKCPYVFVYGTLKSKEDNHSILQTSEFIAEAITLKPFKLYDTGLGYPIVIPNYNGYRVKGEVYKITSEEVMKALDYLEGYPAFYDRQIIKVRRLDNDEVLLAWIYYVKQPFGKKIKEIKPTDKKDRIVEWKSNSRR